ncbi:Cyclic AMP-responsive element-binding protein 3-like 3 [Dinothrombium tinctorium]|uniref:Cyclic AMP-responsive element-binding protein 3-like 3 n=1 Tax=Dinothrombium tinctorium TaxID=1965070 RepID=A0A3S3SG25_9ACAR|nr:Cyclic AMP-responsive element-binding protein 3-like 3 [Dinothrombium tinctorium]
MSELNCETLGFLSNDVLHDEKLFADVLELGFSGNGKLDDDFLQSDVNWFSNCDSLVENACCDEQSKSESGNIKREAVENDCDDSFIDDLLSKNFGNLDDNGEILMDAVIDNVIEVDSSHEDVIDEAIISTVTIDTDSNCSRSIDGEEDNGNRCSSMVPIRIEMHHNYCSPKNDISPSSSVNSSPNMRKSGGQTRGSRSKAITDLTLTEEEIRLLSKEGYPNFPRNGSTPLTKQEERILRKIRRKIRNKKSAQCSRQRKKEYLDDLERRYEKCTNDNNLLKKENLRLKKANDTLLMKLKRLMLLSGFSNGQTSFKTSFFVLILSFLLIIFPYFSSRQAHYQYLKQLLNLIEHDLS